ncbi:MAG TPA: DnaJ domain-containing protein [Bauldia sp.]|nr:DnaJ domain-containing protein [Bauldia sp.]
MAYLFAGVVVLVVLVLLGRAFIAADPRSLVRYIRYIVGSAMIAFGGVLILARRWEFGVPLIAGGVSALTLGRIGPIDLGGGRKSPGSVSQVRSAFLDMQLDHDSGKLTGTVLGGAYAGKNLDDLDVEALRKLYREVAIDPESLALLEAYLDRRLPGWREDLEGDAATGTRRPADAGPMTDEEAYQILGLAPGASEAEIRAAHRNLMKRLHPDQGGSTFLAAKINEAKDRLLGRRHR